MAPDVLLGQIRRPGETVATRHAPYGMAKRSSRAGGLQHAVAGVTVRWKATPPIFSATWRCGGQSWNAVLLLAAHFYSLCRVCRVILEAEAMGAVAGQPAVYYAQRPDGLIKIGYSANIGQRVQALKAELLAAEPFGPQATEVQRHREFAAAQVEGEWFRPTPGLLAHIERLKSQAAS